MGNTCVCRAAPNSSSPNPLPSSEKLTFHEVHALPPSIEEQVRQLCEACEQETGSVEFLVEDFDAGKQQQQPGDVFLEQVAAAGSEQVLFFDVNMLTTFPAREILLPP